MHDNYDCSTYKKSFTYECFHACYRHIDVDKKRQDRQRDTLRMNDDYARLYAYTLMNAANVRKAVVKGLR